MTTKKENLTELINTIFHARNEALGSDVGSFFSSGYRVWNAEKERREACGASIFYGVADNIVTDKFYNDTRRKIARGRVTEQSRRYNLPGGSEWWLHMK